MNDRVIVPADGIELTDVNSLLIAGKEKDKAAHVCLQDRELCSDVARDRLE